MYCTCHVCILSLLDIDLGLNKNVYVRSHVTCVFCETVTYKLILLRQSETYMRQ